MTDILITDYYSASNRGDAAILEGVMSSVSNVINDASYEVITENPQSAQLLHDIPIREQQISPQQWMSWLKNGSFTERIRDFDLSHYREADIIISTGGHHLTDTYYPAKLGMLAELLFCTRCAGSVAMVGQTCGPFNNKMYKLPTKRVLNKIDLITVRDRQSLENLKQIGVNDTKIYYTADAAFAINTENTDVSSLSTKRNERIPNLQNKSVTISVRRIDEFFSCEEQKEYINSISYSADNLIEKGYNVVFASTCTGLDGYTKDDRMTAHTIVDTMKNSGATILSGEYSPYDLTNIYKQAELHIGTRMHSCILALLSGTPVIGLEYQFKVKELFSQINLKNYSIPIKNLNPSLLDTTIEDALDNLTDIEYHVSDAVEERRSAAMKTGRLAEQILIDQ